MEEMLNRKSLFVRDIDAGVPKAEVKSDLQVVCPKEMGQICVPVDAGTQACSGTAYCNFYSAADAREALQQHRFKLKIGGKPVNITYAVSGRDRMKIMGNWGFRLSIIVKNLSPNVTIEMFCPKFEVFGEIFRCKVGCSESGKTYGLAQYINERSVYEALRGAHMARWMDSVIIVERHDKIVQQEQPYGVPIANRYGAFDPNNLISPRVRPVHSGQHTPREAPVLAQNGGLDANHSPSALPNPNAAARRPSPWLSPRTANSPAPRMPSQDVHQPHYPLNIAKGQSSVASNSSQTNFSFNIGRSDREAEATHSTETSATGVVDIFDVFDKRRQLHQRGTKPSSSAQHNEVSSLSPASVLDKPQSVEKTQRLGEIIGSLAKILTRWTGGPGDYVGLLCCPITHEIFCDPVMATDGNTYERKAIQEWFSKNSTSPLTNMELKDKTLTPNHLVKRIVQESA